MKPVIGITPSPLSMERPYGTDERFAVGVNYVNAVLAAGGIPIALPPQLGHNDEILAMVDGLLFSGGADIDPARYGDTEVHPTTYEISELRDEFELELIKAAVERDIPTFCICRGIQVLNVAMGGTLIQDVPDQYSADLQHRQSDAEIKASEPIHAVTVDPVAGAKLGYGATSVATNSFHHQALKKIGDGLQVVARSEDGIVEAVVAPDKTFVAGVQWHPEMMFAAHDEHLRPFLAFIEAARSAKLAGAKR